MSGIKKHPGNNNGHHHLATFNKKGHSYTYLHCDSKTHQHTGKHSHSRHEGFEQYLVAIDGVKINSAKSHNNHHNATDTLKHAHKTKKHKHEMLTHSGHHGGEAANALRRKTRKAAKSESRTPKSIKVAPVQNAENKNPTSQTIPANPASDNKAPQVQQNLAQFIAANADSVIKYPIDQNGKASADNQTGIAILKDNETGKLMAYGEMMSSIELSSQDPTNLSPEDKAKIEAAIRAGKLSVGSLAEAPAASSAPNTGTPINKSDTTKPEADAGTTQVNPNGIKNTGSPTTMQPATEAPGGGSTSVPAVTPETGTTPDATSETPAAK